jgi:hypothetical protein
MPITVLTPLPTLPLTRRQALGVVDTSAVSLNDDTENSSESPLSSSLSPPTNSPPPAEVTNAHIVAPAEAELLAHTSASLLDDDTSDSLSESSELPIPLLPRQMSSNTPAECLHAEPKRIPLLTPGEVSPMVMRQWEMACEDFFSANKKLEEVDCVTAILPGLKDMRARDWVATHRDHLVTLAFGDFMKELHREFLSKGWDDELHARICNARLKPNEPFAKWVNDIRHTNIILRGTEYHFSDDALRLST